MSETLRVVAWPAERNRAEQPYNRLLAESLRAHGTTVEEYRARAVLSRPDVWHMHWPDSILNDPRRPRAMRNLIGLVSLMRVARARGTAVVWTVHNLYAHDRLYPRAEAWFWRAFIPLLDGVICLSETSRVAALDRFPHLAGRPSFVIPIGHYRGIYPDSMSAAEARSRLGLESHERVVSFIGQIRPYKGVPLLIRRFRDLPDPDVRLVVAGRPNSESLAREVRSAAGEDPRIRLRLGFIADDEIQIILRATDLVALPFVEILNSASAMLALSFDRPVLVPQRGSMSELAGRVGEQWVRVHDGPLTTPELADAIRWATDGPRNQAPLDAFEWSAIGASTVRAYREIVATRRRATA